jgi:hypothetical protein
MTGHNHPVQVYHLMFANDSRGELAESKNLFPLLSIGQMIELLAGKNNAHDEPLNFFVYDIEIYKPSELCDELWKEVKQVMDS